MYYNTRQPIRPQGYVQQGYQQQPGVYGNQLQPRLQQGQAQQRLTGQQQGQDSISGMLNNFSKALGKYLSV